MRCICHQCGAEIDKPVGAVNRASAQGAKLFCGKVCFGLSRRRKVPLTEAQRKEQKSEYDRQRRAELGEKLRAEKRAAYYANHEASKAKHAIYRKKRMPKHVEYCRQPAYRAWKAQYDRRHRAKEFGDYAEAFLLLQDVEREVEARATRYEIYLTNGTINKAQTRRREL